MSTGVDLNRCGRSRPHRDSIQGPSSPNESDWSSKGDIDERLVLVWTTNQSKGNATYCRLSISLSAISSETWIKNITTEHRIHTVHALKRTNKRYIVIKSWILRFREKNFVDCCLLAFSGYLAVTLALCALRQNILEYGGGSGDFRRGVYHTWKLTRFGTYNVGRDLMTPGPACV